MTRGRALLASGVTALIAFVALAAPAHAVPVGVPEGRRVVVLSVPGLTWKDIEAPELPNLRALLDRARSPTSPPA